MPLYQFHCINCRQNFEELVRPSEIQSNEFGFCPLCNNNCKDKKLVSTFKTTGRGDVRESSEFHGCHRCVGHNH